MQNRKLVTAISLLEFLLVLCLAAVIVLVAARQYLKYTETQKIATLSNSAQLLLTALNAYYQSDANGCQQILNDYQNSPTNWRNANIPVDLSILVDHGYLKNTQMISNPFYSASQGTPFSMSIDTSQSPFVLNVVANFDSDISTIQLEAIAAKILSGTMDIGTYQMTWQIVTNADTSYTGYGMSTQQASIQKFTDEQSAKLMKYGIISNVKYPCSAIEAYLKNK
ncbi:MAG: hypothetical protein CMF49_05380 [Legionellales bacterium]|nr:hypothetical protein [Legionellales bacterium]